MRAGGEFAEISGQIGSDQQHQGINVHFLIEDLYFESEVCAVHVDCSALNILVDHNPIDGFVVGSIVTTGLYFPAVEVAQSDGSRTFRPSQMSPIQIQVSGTTNSSLDSELQVWWNEFKRHSTVRKHVEIQVSSISAPDISLGIEYEFYDCIPTAYSRQILGASTGKYALAEQVELLCPRLHRFRHDYRPQLASWIMDMVEGRDPYVYSDLSVLWLDIAQQEISRDDYVETFPMSYSIPSFDAASRRPLREGLLIKPNEKL
jgi:hypothetical protein